MRTLLSVLVAVVLLAVPLGLATTASASPGTSDRSVTTSVTGPVATARFGGGEMVVVSAGSTNFGVFYGTAGHPNNLIIFAEYTRVLGGAEVVDAQGQYLANRGIPVDTVLAQSLNRFIEFNTTNLNAGLDLLTNGTMGGLVNLPVKILDLNTGSWQLTHLGVNTAGNVTTVDLNVTATDLRYTWIAPRASAPDQVGDGMLNNLTFSFHLVVSVATKTLTLPWYTVTVTNGAPREITNVTFAGNRTLSGPAVEMSAKYDHMIQGWDFANPGNRLALETHLLFGNYFPDRTVDFIHQAYYHDYALAGNETARQDAATLTNATPPRILTVDQVVFDDSWSRVGRFTWTSNVTVDGAAASMLFQVQGGGRLLLGQDGAVFAGFWIRGAFVYPAGAMIVHDPAMSAEAFVPAVASGFNLTPLGILLIQVAVVGVAIIPALYLRSRARRRQT